MRAFNPEAERAAELEASVEGQECIRCESEPRVAWLDGTHKLRCNCHPGEPVLHKAPSPIARRLKRMGENEG